MRRLPGLLGRGLGLTAVLVPLAGALGYAGLRTGPLAPVPVTVVIVERKAIAPALYGIGTVEARATHRIGPTSPGRLRQLTVQPGDRVRAGQVLGEMEPVDLDERVRAQDAALARGQAAAQAAQAQVAEAGARQALAESELRRQEALLAARFVSPAAAEIRQKEARAAGAAAEAARANLDASRQELARLRAEREALRRQRANLRLVSPVDGLVVRREADPGTTVVAGQAVVEVIEPDRLWINARFDQQRAAGLRAGLAARVWLRSRPDAPRAARVARIEPHADAQTEELLAKIELDPGEDPAPPIGELAEVSVALAASEPLPVVPNASLHRVGGRLGVWVIEQGRLRFAPVTPAAVSLEGEVQVSAGLEPGARVVAHSREALDARRRIAVVDRVPY